VWCDCFDVVYMGSPAIIRLCRYIVYFNHFNNHNHIGVATWRVRGCGPCKRSRYSNRAVGNSNKCRRHTVKQVVYDEFMKQIRTVRHSFNTTGTANYKVQLAVSHLTKNNYNNHNHNKYTKKLRIFN